MRILKWLAIVSLPIALIIGYIFISAIKSGVWLDHVFLELSQDWNAEVIIRNASATSQKTGSSEGLQLALNDLKRARLLETTAAACTHGPNYTAGEGWDLRSRCFLWAKFDGGVVRFEVDLQGFWNQWEIKSFNFYPEASNGA